jgi:hypothetical protein
LETLSRRSRYKKDVEPFINSIANTCLVSTLSNQTIGKKPPSEYLASFEVDIKQVLASHLVTGASYEALMRNDFRGFLRHRSHDILEALKQKYD